MIATLEEVKKGIHSINKIAILYGVPRSTLHDHTCSRVEHGSKPAPAPYLNAKEEKVLADHLVTVAKIGYGKTRTEVKLLVEKVVSDRGTIKGT